jgi:hypothetical protein
LFVFSCKTSEEAYSLAHIKRNLDKVLWSLKACTHNPMGNIIWNYCQESEVYIMNYMMGVHYSEDAVQEKITSSIDTAIKNGYSIKFSTHLDQFMVIYNIIRVLRDEMGYRLA